MDKYIVIINGTGGSGKDSFVEFVSKYNKVVNVSSVDKVKDIATLMGWDGGKTEKDRKFLSDLKKLATDYNEMPLRDMKEKVEKFKESDNEIMFLHIREPEEIQKAVDIFGAITLLIRREGHKTITSNYSDASVENYNYDYIITNSTLEKLEEDAKNFYQKISNNKTYGYTITGE